MTSLDHGPGGHPTRGVGVAALVERHAVEAGGAPRPLDAPRNVARYDRAVDGLAGRSAALSFHSAAGRPEVVGDLWAPLGAGPALGTADQQVGRDVRRRRGRRPIRTDDLRART